MSQNPVRVNDPTRGGAVWCEEHQRWECTKNVKEVRGGGRCHGIAIAGIDRCRMHAGKRSEVAKAQGEAITAWSALTGKPTVSAVEAVSKMLEMSWLRAHLYAGLLEAQVAQAQDLHGADDGPGGGSGGAGSVGPGVGLVGHTFAAVKDVGIYASGEAIRGLAQLEAAERDRCVRYAKAAHDMGIADQEIKLAQQQGQLLAEAVRRICDALLAAVVALVDEQAHADLPMDVFIREQFARVVTAAVMSAWPSWLGEIVPREFRAISAGSDQ